MHDTLGIAQPRVVSACFMSVLDLFCDIRFPSACARSRFTGASSLSLRLDAGPRETWHACRKPTCWATWAASSACTWACPSSSSFNSSTSWSSGLCDSARCSAGMRASAAWWRSHRHLHGPHCPNTECRLEYSVAAFMLCSPPSWGKAATQLKAVHCNSSC